MKNLFSGILFILLSALTASADNGWQMLFNGKDLSGWRGTVDDDAFTVVDGMIRANAIGKQMNHLYYTGNLAEGYYSFKNFEFEVSVRSEPNSNSGIYFHTDTSPRNNRYMMANGYEVQLNSSKKEKRKTGSLYRVIDLDQSVVDESRWFQVNIKVTGKHILVHINDELIIDYTEPDNPERDKNHEGKRISPEGGAIAFQAHDPKSIFYFKDIRVRELP
ncbi:MAG: DUF1080 domain-containing protein [Verrucomicrobiota bacterium]